VEAKETLPFPPHSQLLLRTCRRLRNRSINSRTTLGYEVGHCVRGTEDREQRDRSEKSVQRPERETTRHDRCGPCLAPRACSYTIRHEGKASGPRHVALGACSRAGHGGYWGRVRLDERYGIDNMGGYDMRVEDVRDGIIEMYDRIGKYRSQYMSNRTCVNGV
jgi:hypothetical protein